ncbi:Pumilio-like protein 5 [Forsythia ovata]|uniref:Pumilio-like protein 5 n=1 Tax=Forsythia ovata TaxID=205694 RepID=A0ABD1PF93_9LAMI
MATENPMRILESSQARKWASSKDSASNIAIDELGLLLKAHNTRGDRNNMVFNRSDSAPPSIEGSFAAFGNLINRQSSGSNSSLATLSSALENFQSEEQLCTDPYFAYYSSNPRLPPPIISRENRHQASGSNWRLSSPDGGNQSFHMPRSSLPVHDEEPEDASSSKKASGDWAESSGHVMPGQNRVSFTGRNKNLVNLIQEDFPRTPSPVFNHSHSSSHVMTEEVAVHDVETLPFENLSLNASKLPESKSAPDFCSEVAIASGSTAIKGPSVNSIPKLDALGASPSALKSDVTGKNIGSGNVFLKVEQSRSKPEDYEKNVTKQPNAYLQQHNGSSRGAYNVQNDTEKVSLGHVQFSSAEIQPLHTPGPTPPLYATAAASMGPGNPFYPNLNASGLYAPQYSGYALGSAFLPPFVAGYPTHSGLPMHFNANSGQSYGGQNAVVLTGESIPKGSNMQNIDKFYGQHGLMMRPSFPNPLPIQYFQHPVEDAYGAPGQFGRVPSLGVVRGQADSFASPKDTTIASYIGDQNFLSKQNANLSFPSPRNMGIAGSSYFGSPTGLGFMPQFPASPLGSPVLPGSPVGGANISGRKNDNGVFQGSVRNSGGYAGWVGQKRSDSFNNPRKHSFLEELKAGSARRIDLSEIKGCISEFSVDQHGSRFIQQKMENCSVEEKESVFREILPHASKLMTDVFGNYVIQKFFEHGSREQRRELANQLSGKILPLSFQMYGCRVIQKALEVIELDQEIELVHELDGHVMRCVRDQNGNHVIQKCIECIPTEKIDFIISAFRSQVATLSTHPYGCRVIQRVLEHCPNDLQSRFIIDEILESAYDLAQDQYGNYVIQHVLERRKSYERSHIISKLSGRIVQMSQHKYASNVVEKCLEYGDATERDLLIEEILAQSGDTDNMLTMMKDQYANYVVQKILEICSDKQQESLLDRIRVHRLALKKYTYGKHIVARFEELYGEGEDI